MTKKKIVLKFQKSGMVLGLKKRENKEFSFLITEITRDLEEIKVKKSTC